jgi:putative transposase
MGRSKRAGEASGIYHAMNRGNSQCGIFRNPEDFDLLRRILAYWLQMNLSYWPQMNTDEHR